MCKVALKPAEAVPEDVLLAYAGQLTQMEPWSRLGYTAARLYRQLSARSPERHAYIITCDDQDAGILCLRGPWWNGIYVELLAVFPQWQARGIGRGALEAAVAIHRDRWSNIWLLVSGFNRDAQCFYRRLGFETIGCLRDLILDGEDEILMRKRLGPGA